MNLRRRPAEGWVECMVRMAFSFTSYSSNSYERRQYWRSARKKAHKQPINCHTKER
jgi:hypothetical protein